MLLIFNDLVYFIFFDEIFWNLGEIINSIVIKYLFGLIILKVLFVNFFILLIDMGINKEMIVLNVLFDGKLWKKFIWLKLIFWLFKLVWFLEIVIDLEFNL